MPEIWAFAMVAAVASRITRLVGWADVTTRSAPGCLSPMPATPP